MKPTVYEGPLYSEPEFTETVEHDYSSSFAQVIYAMLGQPFYSKLILDKQLDFHSSMANMINEALYTITYEKYDTELGKHVTAVHP